MSTDHSIYIMPALLMSNFNLFYEGAFPEVRSTDEETVVNRVCLLIEGQKFVVLKVSK